MGLKEAMGYNFHFMGMETAHRGKPIRVEAPSGRRRYLPLALPNLPSFSAPVCRPKSQRQLLRTWSTSLRLASIAIQEGNRFTSLQHNVFGDGLLHCRRGTLADAEEDGELRVQHQLASTISPWIMWRWRIA